MCKKWRQLSLESWYTFKRLDLSPVTWGWTDKTKVKSIDNRVFLKLFQRCGYYLKVVDLSMRNYPSHRIGLFQNLNFQTIELICQSCPNMQALNLTDVDIDQMRSRRFISRKRRFMFLQACEQRRSCERATLRECERGFCLCELVDNTNYEQPINPASLAEEEVHEMMESLSFCCQNLTKFGMGMRYLGYSAADLFKLFDKMRSVKHLRLTTVQGVCLTHLSFETIEELFLGACNGIYPDHLCNVSINYSFSLQRKFLNMFC